MKIFCSWQADTPGDTGRFFVRNALLDAVKQLKQPEDVEEPIERDLREAIHVDQDRQGVSGSPSLAETIFAKIDRSQVFVADVTLVATSPRLKPAEDETPEKRLINSNVAIEYGRATHSSRRRDDPARAERALRAAG
jgi:hypothetical protein